MFKIFPNVFVGLAVDAVGVIGVISLSKELVALFKFFMACNVWSKVFDSKMIKKISLNITFSIHSDKKNVPFVWIAGVGSKGVKAIPVVGFRLE